MNHVEHKARYYAVKDSRNDKIVEAPFATKIAAKNYAEHLNEQGYPGRFKVCVDVDAAQPSPACGRPIGNTGELCVLSDGHHGAHLSREL